MVELGRRQAEENARFARVVAAVADDLVIVGRTNRCGWVAGAHSLADGPEADVHRDGGQTSYVLVDHREEAVAWVRDHLGAGDAVLYENDLPDHYP